MQRERYIATPPSKGKLLYHMTHINNMESILKYGLLPRRVMVESHKRFTDIADKRILADREHHVLNLSEFVPFHFFAKNPFDGAVCNDYGSENMVIITIHRDLHLSEPLFIIPEHPLHQRNPQIFSYNEGIDLIRWDILDDIPNRDYHNREIKEACMAECLVPHSLMPDQFFAIYLQNENEKSILESLEGFDQLKNCLILVKPAMFP